MVAVAADGTALPIQLGHQPFLGVHEIADASRRFLTDPAPEGIVGVSGDDGAILEDFDKSPRHVVSVFGHRSGLGIGFLHQIAVGVEGLLVLTVADELIGLVVLPLAGDLGIGLAVAHGIVGVGLVFQGLGVVGLG